MSIAYEEPDAVEKLARMIAGCPTFQEAIGKDGALLAEERVHRMLVIRADDLPRPWALVELGGINSKREAGGERNIYSYDAGLVFKLCGEMAIRNDPKLSLKQFARFAYRVFLEIHDVGGYDDNLNITGMEQIQEPVLSGEVSGKVVPYCWTSWRVPYGTF